MAEKQKTAICTETVCRPYIRKRDFSLSHVTFTSTLSFHSNKRNNSSSNSRKKSWNRGRYTLCDSSKMITPSKSSSSSHFMIWEYLQILLKFKSAHLTQVFFQCTNIRMYVYVFIYVLIYHIHVFMYNTYIYICAYISYICIYV